MPATIYVRPEEVWQERRLLSWSVAWCLARMLFKGWRRSRKRGRDPAGPQS